MRAERHADACRRVAFRGLGYGGGSGDDASSSPADAASGSGAARRVGGATRAEAPTGDVDRPGGGAKPGTEGVCVERDRPGRAETAPQSFRYDAAGGGGVHQWNNLWFPCYPKYTQMLCCAINLLP
jgi:hypothetical protein